MLLFFGWRPRSKTVDTGIFHCPREGGDRGYELKESRRWFTLFFIPVIPLNELGDFVECAGCKSTFYPSVLEERTSGQIQDITTIAIRHVATAMLHADGTVDPLEREAALTVVQRFASTPYSEADLEADLSALSADDLTDHLEELGSILSPDGRENVLTSAVYLAGSDGHVDPHEMEVARRVGRALTMSSAHIEGTVQQELARLGLTN